MELKIKYQYTYFIKPYSIDTSKYEQYLLNLLNSKNCSLKIFEKERDLNIYSYFIEDARNYFFPTFDFNKKDFEDKSNKEKAKILSKFHCNIFEYRLDNNPQGKVQEAEDESIFFNIDKIEIICFDSGICFLSLKTNIENSEKFSDLLNFNYKFKDLNTDYAKLKEYNDIKIQTNTFENMTDITEFINSITQVNTKTIDDTDIYNKRFFVYTYCSIDQEYWNSEESFKSIENEFIKYTNVLSNNSTLNFNAPDFKDNYQEYQEFKYTKFGFTKQSASLFTSNIDLNNYNKILFDFENEYLYTLIISLYQRMCLKKIEKDLKKNIKLFYKFTNELWFNEITNSLTGTKYYNKWKEIFELKNIYKKIKEKYEIGYKQLGIENTSKANKVISIALIVSLILNVINFIVVAKLL